MIKNNPKVTQIGMSEKLGITPRAVKKNMKELVQEGVLSRVGSSRDGYWKIEE